MEAESPVDRDELFAGAEDGDAPPGRARDPAELVQQVFDLAGLADRVAAHERAPVHHAVGEKCAPRRREQEAFVATEREVGKTVSPPVPHNRAGLRMLGVAVRPLVVERVEP